MEKTLKEVQLRPYFCWNPSKACYEETDQFCRVLIFNDGSEESRDYGSLGWLTTDSSTRYPGTSVREV